MDKYKFKSKKDLSNKEKFSTKSEPSDTKQKFHKNNKNSFGFNKNFDKFKNVKTASFVVQKSNEKPSRNSEGENSFAIEKKSVRDKISKSGHSFGKSNKTDDYKNVNLKTKEGSGNQQHKNIYKNKTAKIDKPNKKPFDKKTWRLQKYSKKYKLEQWEEKRKKMVLREYYKELKDEKPKMDVKKIYEQYEKEIAAETGEQVSKEFDVDGIEFSEITESTPEKATQTEVKINEKLKKKFKKNAYKKAQAEIERLKQEKLAAKEEILKQKAERKEALKRYKIKKNEKYKKLNKKTKKGQPIMKGRIEMLLEKIQSS